MKTLKKPSNSALGIAFGLMIVRTTDPLNLQDIPANKRAVGDAYPSADVEAIDSNAIALHFCEYCFITSLSHGR
jgi:hypothetical protein